jgi:hypothetical protein
MDIADTTQIAATVSNIVFFLVFAVGYYKMIKLYRRMLLVAASLFDQTRDYLSRKASQRPYRLLRIQARAQHDALCPGLGELAELIRHFRGCAHHTDGALR